MALANVTLSDTFDIWRTRTNQLIAVYDETNLLSRAAYNATNTFVSSTANLTANLIMSNTVTMGVIYNNANTIIAANAANIIYSNTTILNTFYNNANTIVNAYIATNPIAPVSNTANAANATAIAAFAQANTANTTAIAAFAKANTAGGGYFRGNNGDAGQVANKNDIFRINTANVTANMTFTAWENASATGPLYLADNVVLTIETNARVVIL